MTLKKHEENKYFLRDVDSLFWSILEERDINKKNKMTIELLNKLCNENPYIEKGGHSVNIKLGELNKGKEENDIDKTLANYDKKTDEITVDYSSIMEFYKSANLAGLMHYIYHEYTHFKQAQYDNMKREEIYNGKTEKEMEQIHKILISNDEYRLSPEAMKIMIMSVDNSKVKNHFLRLSEENQKLYLTYLSMSQYAEIETEKDAERNGFECSKLMLELLSEDEFVSDASKKYYKNSKKELEDEEKNSFILNGEYCKDYTEIKDIILKKSNIEIVNYLRGLAHSINQMADNADESERKKLINAQVHLEKYFVAKISSEYSKQDIENLLYTIYLNEPTDISVLTSTAGPLYDQVFKAYYYRPDVTESDIETLTKGIKEEFINGDVPLHAYKKRMSEDELIDTVNGLDEKNKWLSLVRLISANFILLDEDMKPDICSAMKEKACEMLNDSRSGKKISLLELDNIYNFLYNYGVMEDFSIFDTIDEIEKFTASEEALVFDKDEELEYLVSIYGKSNMKSFEKGIEILNQRRKEKINQNKSLVDAKEILTERKNCSKEIGENN